MNSQPQISAPFRIRPSWLTGFAVALLVVATLAAYANTFSVPYIFDDFTAIRDNPSIRQLWPPWEALTPPANGETVTGRPLLNYSFALNYAVSGADVWSYHALNLLIHLAAGLVLFGIVRRTLRRPLLHDRFGADSQSLALATALLWTLHPLQTESVTYLAQRAESLMGLLYLLTLYAFIRGTESPRPWRWHTLSVATCLLGMATKEVMVTAPLVIYIYDRTFVAGTFREAWRRRGPYYTALAGTWLPLAWLVVGAADRGQSAGFGLGVDPWSYALRQCEAVTDYLRLSFWPHPLVFDYGDRVVTHPAEVIGPALLLVLLLAATIYALWRRPTLGFLGAWFFLILAPSSSIMPVVLQSMAEHRLYLSLAAVVVLFVTGLYAWAGRRSLLLAYILAILSGWLTFQRNTVYGSELSIWSDTVAKCPDNWRAQDSLGVALAANGQSAQALARFQESLRLNRDNLKAEFNLGSAYLQAGNLPAALAHTQAALRISPNDPESLYQLGYILLDQNQPAAALDPFMDALRADPNYAKPHNGLGCALAQLGRAPEALAQYRQAVQLAPNYVEARNNLGVLLDRTGQGEEAVRQFEEVLRLDPTMVQAHKNLGALLSRLGHSAPAIQQFQIAIKENPNDAEAYFDLGNTLALSGRVPDAVAQYKTAIQLQPAFTPARQNLGQILLQLGRPREAARQFEQILLINPDDASAQRFLDQSQEQILQSPNQ